MYLGTFIGSAKRKKAGAGRRAAAVFGLTRKLMTEECRRRKEKMYNISFKPKSKRQKTDCIARTINGCVRKSVLEVYLPMPIADIRIRCCTESECQDRAKEVAIRSAEKITESL